MTEQQYSDGDFVYVDPEKREVVGLVEWTTEGTPVPKEREYPDVEGDDKAHRQRKKRRYPWGTFATMNRIYKLKGRSADAAQEESMDLEHAMQKAQEEPYWN